MSKQMLFESKKKVKLNDLSDLLKIKKSTIKSWEKEFNLPSLSAESTQKLYSEQEVKLLKLIKKMLYEEKLSYQEIQEKITLFLQNEAEKTFNPAQSLESHDVLEAEEPVFATPINEVAQPALPEETPSVETKKTTDISSFKERLTDIENRLLLIQAKLK